MGVQAADAVNVTATDTPTITATTVAASLSAGLIGVAVGALTANSTVDDNVSAYIDPSQVTANNGNIAVTATSYPNITTTSAIAAVSVSLGLAGAGGNSQVTIEGCTQAYVTASTLSAPGNSVLVEATTTSTANPTETGTSVGAISVTAITSEANIEGTTQAYAGGGTTINATSLNIQAMDTGSSDSDAVVTGVGFASGAGVSSTSTVSRTVQAYIAPNAVIHANGGSVTVAATSTATPDANVTGVSVGAIAVVAETVTDTVSGKTYAYIGEGASVYSGSLNVTATSNNSAIAAPTNVGVGLGVGTGANIASNVTPDVEAFIGPQAGGTPTGDTTIINVGGGMVSVQATSTNTATANLNNIAVGGVTISALFLSANLGGSTSAYGGGTMNVTAGSLGLAANSTNVSSSTLFAVNVSAINGSGNSLTPTETHNTLAYIAGGANLAAGGASLSVTATSNSSATADIEGGSGSVVGVSVDLPSASITGSTLAYVGEGATVTAGSLNLQSSAASQNVLAKIHAINVGILASGAGANADSSVSGNIEAFIGPQAGSTPLGLTTTVNLTGALTVQASTAANPTTNVYSGGGGAITVSALITDAKVDDQTLAYLSTGVHVTNAGSLSVLATETDGASNSTEIASGARLNGQGTNATAEAQPTISGYIASDDCVTTTGAVLVQSISTAAEATATAKAYGGGGIQVGVPHATVTSSPTVLGYIGSGANVSAGGNVTVYAASNSTPTQSQPVTDNIQNVNTSTSVITFPNSGLQTGDLVDYVQGTASSPIGTPSGPLETTIVQSDGTITQERSYPVLVIDANTLQLRAQFNAQQADTSGYFSSAVGIDPTLDVIRFATPDGLETGDAVEYNPNGNTQLAGLNTSSVYYVRTIDPYTIKLYNTYAEATATPTGVTPSDVNTTNNTIDVSNSFTNGETVTYEAPAPFEFQSSEVDVESNSNGSLVLDSNNNPEYNLGANNIYIGQNTTGARCRTRPRTFRQAIWCCTRRATQATRSGALPAASITTCTGKARTTSSSPPRWRT